VAATTASVLAEHARSRAGLEWLVVEDGPDGQTQALVGDAAAQTGGLWDCQGVRAGVSAARTRALVHARGEVVLTLDGDDVLAEGVADAIADVFRGDPELVAVAGAQAGVLGAASAGDVRVAGTATSRRWAVGELADAWTSPFPFHPGLVAYRTDTLLRLGGWPALAGGEDRALVLAANTLGPIMATAIPVSFYRLWSAQTTAGAAYDNSKGVYERLTWLFTDARLRATREVGLAPELPRRPGRP